MGCHFTFLWETSGEQWQIGRLADWQIGSKVGSVGGEAQLILSIQQLYF